MTEKKGRKKREAYTIEKKSSRNLNSNYVQLELDSKIRFCFFFATELNASFGFVKKM